MIDPAEIHATSIVIDTHADTPQRFVDEGWNFTDPLGTGMLNLESARRGGLSAEFLAIWVEPIGWQGHFAFRTRQLIDATLAQIAAHPTELRLGLSPADIVQAHTDGVFCILMGIEGGHSIEADLNLLREYHRSGVRYMTLTWSNSNEWAESSGDISTATTLGEPSASTPHGLTTFGRGVVREMNRLGMMVDVSHVSDATFWDVLQTTHAPIIASHSSARAITAAPRNLTDEQLRAVATNNGVVMVNFYPSFIDDNWRTAWHATEAQRAPLYEAAAQPCIDLRASFRDRTAAATLFFDRSLRSRGAGRRHRSRRHRHRFRRVCNIARRYKKCRRPAEGHCRTCATRLHR
jgi:membrane dipeptidase